MAAFQHVNLMEYNEFLGSWPMSQLTVSVKYDHGK